ncbi:hypothetical protein [Streptomyces sp. yr375]|nr:hypothetical protein [Streptomyces sp. yr375]
MDDQHTNPASAMLRRKLFDGLGRAERTLFPVPRRNPRAPR